MSFFIWQVLHGCVNTLNRLSRRILSLVGLFCCILRRKAEKTLITFFGVVILLILFGTFSSRRLACRLPIACCRGTRDIIKEFLLHPPFREKGQFLWLARICAIMCNLWGKMYNRVFEGLERELEDVELLLGFTIHFGLRIRIFFFCNNSIGTILLDWLSFFLEGSLFCRFGFLYALIFFHFSQ